MRVLELSSARILAGFPLPKEWQTSLRKDSCAASGKERLFQRHANPEREGEDGPCCTSGNSHADPAGPDVHGSTVLDFVYGEADEISILFKDSRKSRGEVPGILRQCLRMISRSCSRQGNRCEYLNFSRNHLPRKMSRRSFGNENIFTDGAASVSNSQIQFLIEFGIDELCRHSLRWHSRKRPDSRSFADDCSKKQGLENGEFPTLYVGQRWLSTTLKKVFVLPEAKRAARQGGPFLDGWACYQQASTEWSTKGNTTHGVQIVRATRKINKKTGYLARRREKRLRGRRSRVFIAAPGSRSRMESEYGAGS
ncbi:hypothetical protein MNR02_05345 [Shinella sp. H4-D48]|uniref:hypothetical protein n=1 Tax=Shinella sp. H4-D48 TaxID=2925841 RepID=UPI001F52D459|nr:hypothetical protein [Shinella sp. H4-D48]UNK39128.1 hypothetical protein MNR02_05345 [Shinella sp. H4-D48]